MARTTTKKNVPNRRSTRRNWTKNDDLAAADAGSVDSASIYTSSVVSRTNFGTATTTTNATTTTTATNANRGDDGQKKTDSPHESDVESSVLQRQLQAHVERVLSERNLITTSSNGEWDSNINRAKHVVMTSYSDEENDDGDYDMELMMDSVPPILPSTTTSADSHRRALVIAQSQHRGRGLLRMFTVDRKRFKSGRRICLIAMTLLILVLAGAIALVLLRYNHHKHNSTATTTTTLGQQNANLSPSVVPAVVPVPVHKAPVNKAPVSQAPVTKAPVSQAPVSQAPASQAPVTKAPVTKAPVTKAPVTKAPVTKVPVTASPSSSPSVAPPAVTGTKIPATTTTPVTVTSRPPATIPTAAAGATTNSTKAPTAKAQSPTSARNTTTVTTTVPCVDDPEATFLASGLLERNCDWLESNPMAQSAQCQVPAIKDLCRKTCGVCG